MKVFGHYGSPYLTMMTAKIDVFFTTGRFAVHAPFFNNASQIDINLSVTPPVSIM